MPKLLSALLMLSLSAGLTSCCSSSKATRTFEGRTGSVFSYFPIPTNNHSVGDVVAVYTAPLYRVSTIVRPAPGLQARTTNTSLELSESARSNISASLEAEVAGILSSELSSGRISRVETTLSDVQTVGASEDDIINSLVSKFCSQPSSVRTVRENTDRNIRIQVIESIVVASPNISAYDSTGAKITLDPEAIRRIDAGLKINAESSSNGTVVGSSVGVGFTRNYTDVATRAIERGCDS